MGNCTWGGFRYQAWRNMQVRCGLMGSERTKDSYNYRSYRRKCIKVLITKDEFYQWCDDHKQDWQNLIDKGRRPSIDRIDSNKHYSLDNMRIIDHIINCSYN